MNKLAVVSHKKGLRGDYETQRLHEILLQDRNVITAAIDLEGLGDLRRQVNAVAANDDAVYAAFDDYSAFGNDYTISAPDLLCDLKRKDGFAGYFLWRVFRETDEGRELLDLARSRFECAGDSVTAFLRPVLDNDETIIEWEDTYEEKLGRLSNDRLVGIAAAMAGQTAAILRTLRNAEQSESRYTSLRQLVICFGVWLSLYLTQESSEAAHIIEPPPMFCDFTGNSSRKCRSRSATCFSRHRELVYRAFEFWCESGRISELDAFRNKNSGEYDFKDVERYFLELTVRVGLAQPRAATVRLKHYELQPDTIRTLVMSLLSADEPPVTFPELAAGLRNTWRISLGGCDDDAEYLAAHGIIGLDEDDDLRLNRQCFIRQLKVLGLAFEPSDGLVLCGLELGGLQ